jgi:polar amino acid transport system substrate-binding protein
MVMRLSSILVLPAVAALVLGGCASEADDTAAESASPTASLDCSPDALQTLTPGTLTIGTDTPAYPPYFEDDDPSNGEGFESAVAYAVADELGFEQAQVEWVTVPFNKSYAPGDKDFDFDINQISITPKRQKAVDFSEGYYTVNQAVVAQEDSPIADATTLAELQDAKLGAQVGTTSLDFINEDIQPTQEASVYNDTNDAKSALEAGQIDGIVVDLPTAYYVTAVEFENAKIVGQFPAQDGGEQFGLLMQKGSPLLACVNQAVVALKDSGELQLIQDEYLAGDEAPYFSE